MADLEKKTFSGSEDRSTVNHKERKGSAKEVFNVDEGQRYKLAAAFEGSLAGIPDEKLMQEVEDFCYKYDLVDQLDNMKKGARVSKRPPEIEEVDFSPMTKRTSLSVKRLTSGIIHGMIETANNGALPIYTEVRQLTEERFGSASRAENIQGLVSAPYLACAVLGCWLTQPLNRLFARRGTISITYLIAALASIWEGVVQSWPNLFVARFVLGLGIGAKSATVPVYAAECAPAPIRGALVMQWQLWTAFGIMLGNIIGVAFGGLEPNLAWRLILGSTVVLPFTVCTQVNYCPESPRWLIQKNKHKKAFRSP